MTRDAKAKGRPSRAKTAAALGGESGSRKGFRGALAPPRGTVHAWGLPGEAALLRQAWLRHAAPASGRFTHDFHPYAARMHPDVCGMLIEGFSEVGDWVVDPFCGSGTVAVEAQAAGRRFAGNDLHPLAVRLAATKSQLCAPTALHHFEARATHIARSARGRVSRQETAMPPIDDAEARWYAPHTRLELAVLWSFIERERDPWAQEAFRLAFSAILVKCSFQRSETDSRRVESRMAPGTPLRLFEHRCLTLGRGLGELNRAARRASRPPDTPPAPELSCGDGVAWAHGWQQPRTLVLTSPPYAGYYDYVEHHDRRLAWLGIDATEMQRGERFSRRDQARQSWPEESRALLTSLAAAAGSGGRVLLWIGDPLLDGHIVPARRALADAAHSAGLRWVAGVSQNAPRAREQRREEHVFLLTPRDIAQAA